MPKDPAPRLLATRGPAVTALFDMQEDCVRFGNGVERRLERIEQRSGASVMVIPLLDDRVILVREYGAGSRQYELAFPTGTRYPGESV
jgi:ADP-ribose diphosphatase